MRARVSALVAFVVLLFACSLARAQGGLDDLPGDDNSTLSKELALPDGPADQVIFLHARVDKNKVVVGEQVTLSVYLYYRVAYEMSERRDPKFGDALRYPLLTDPSSTSPVFTKVKGERYGARLVERVGLIPLHPGELVTGGMGARFTGRQIGARTLKVSNDVVVTVEEPPKDGRPDNYMLGDVGQFTVRADVSPRLTQQGGSIGVTIKIEGLGNIPTRVTAPKVDGVKWLEPSRKESVTADQRRLTVGGTRTFQYVVRLERSGDIALGTISVPFFNPTSKKYEVATVDLGSVKVEARAGGAQAAATDPGEAKKREPLWGLPKHRTSAKAFTPRRELVVTMPLFLSGLFGPPLFALLVIAAVRIRASVIERRARSGAQLRGKLKDAMKDAAKADKANDPRSACAAIERAVHAALEAKTGLKTRAYRMEELEPVVTEAGLDQSLATEAKEILSQCESLRFMPTLDEASFEGLQTRAKALTKKLAA